MKKAFSSLLCLALLLGCCLNARAEGATEIWDAAGLRAMASDPGGSYVLCADIDMGGEDWTPLAFSGTLDGGGHTVYNLKIDRVGEDRAVTVDGNHKEYDTVFAGFFSLLRDAAVQNLTLLNVRVEVTTAENCFAALLAGCVENASIANCSLSGTVELHSSNYMEGVGGIAGFGFGSFEDCAADSVLIHVDESSGIKCEQFTGGVLACGFCSINRCQVNIQGYTSCHGYVHDGGLIGMHHQHNDANGYKVLVSSGNQVDGFITFFEDNYDRRAYCEAYCGENLHWTMSLNSNTSSFQRREVFDYSTVLRPHSDCSGTAFTESVTEADCEHWGYTVYTCPLCGYSYRDNYVAPAHVPGDWETLTEATMTSAGQKQRSCLRCGRVLETAEIPAHTPGDWQVTAEPGYDAPGLRQRLCTDCGEVLQEEEIAPLQRVSVVLLGEEELTMEYKSSTRLAVGAGPDSAYDKSLVWSSSDPDVVSVDAEGMLRAVGRGSAVVTCASADGGASAGCRVTVRYSAAQWFIRILLFGWLWY